MTLPFAIGLVLAFGTAAFAAVSRFGRDRAFYPTVLIVVAHYYVLFAAIGGDLRTVLIEAAVMAAFAAAAVRGFSVTPWLVPAGLAAHGLLDAVHAQVVVNAAVPVWWPPFCGAFDIGAAATLAWSMARPQPRRAAAFVVAVIAVSGLAGCSHAMMLAGGGARKPAASEFGLGPRASAQGRYVATLALDGPLRPRRLQTVRVTVADDRGRAIDGATLTIDGGMPQHGHGLPTRPRVTRSLGDGTYEIEGVRFSMGGWWEFRVSIAGRDGADVVTFNLEL